MVLELRDRWNSTRHLAGHSKCVQGNNARPEGSNARSLCLADMVDSVFNDLSSVSGSLCPRRRQPFFGADVGSSLVRRGSSEPTPHTTRTSTPPTGVPATATGTWPAGDFAFL